MQNVFLVNKYNYFIIVCIVKWCKVWLNLENFVWNNAKIAQIYKDKLEYANAKMVN